MSGRWDFFFLTWVAFLKLWLMVIVFKNHGLVLWLTNDVRYIYIYIIYTCYVVGFSMDSVGSGPWFGVLVGSGPLSRSMWVKGNSSSAHGSVGFLGHGLLMLLDP